MSKLESILSPILRCK